MRVIFMGSPSFAVPALRALVAAGHEVTLAISQPAQLAGRGRKLADPEVALAARDLGIPVYQPERVRRPEAVERIALERPEAIIIAAYGQLLPRAILEIPPHGCVNIHPSLLPLHRGPSPIPAALLAGDPITGASIMLLDEGMDTGPVLAHQVVPITDEDDAVTLSPRLADLGAQLLIETLPGLATGEVTPMPQDDSLATVSRLLRREDGALDWRQPAEALWRRVRAVAEWPQAYTSWDGRSVRIPSAYLEREGEAEPGMVVAVGARTRAPSAAGIGTADGLLLPRMIGIEGRRPMPIDAFLRGYPGFIGARLALPDGMITVE